MKLSPLLRACCIAQFLNPAIEMVFCENKLRNFAGLQAKFRKVRVWPLIWLRRSISKNAPEAETGESHEIDPAFLATVFNFELEDEE